MLSCLPSPVTTSLELVVTLFAGYLSGFFMRVKESSQNPIILFDGVCNLCNTAVQFVIKRDRNGLFKFASLQSAFGQHNLEKHRLPKSTFNSFILLENETVYTKSTAALRVARRLAGVWPLIYIFIIIPAFIRNYLYDFVANNRYKWFGKHESCWVPTPELKNKFLDQQ